jgi:hypothetical protein
VSKHFDVVDREEIFHYNWSEGDRTVSFSLRGLKRELGQTLSSTGLTM